MPCDTIQTSTVNLGKLDTGMLMAALTTLGLGPVMVSNVIRFGRGESYDIATGKMELGSRYSTSELKRAYSAEVVKSQAKKFGWQITETGPYQYQVIRR